MDRAAEDGMAADGAVEDCGRRGGTDGRAHDHRGRWNDIRDLGGRDELVSLRLL